MLLPGIALNPCAKTCGSFLFLIGFFISRNETRYRDVLDNVHVLVHGFDAYICIASDVFAAFGLLDLLVLLN